MWRPGQWLSAAAAGVLLAAGCASHGLMPSSDSVPAVSERLARDLGPSDAHRPVVAAIVLRLRDADGLERLVDALGEPGSPQFRHFLTPSEFNARFAPSPQVEARVLSALRTAGFRILRTYDDRSLIDAEAPASTAQRFFSTAIHDFDEGRYGRRYANVAPVVVPPALQPLVDAVELNSVVFATEAYASDEDAVAKSVDVIKNGGFESGPKDWRACGAPQITSQHPFAGSSDLLVGSARQSNGSPDGLNAACQRVTVPKDATLGVQTFAVTNATKVAQGYQEIGLMSQPGKIVAVLRKDLVSRAHWVPASYDLHAYAGQTLYVFFGVFGRGQNALYDSMFVDDVTLKGTPVSPSPSPSASPTSVPPGPGKPLTGPVYGPSSGWAPRGVADGFDLPVQHGYNGRKTTVGVVVQSAVKTADLIAFLTENKVRRTGKLVQTAVNGGPTTGDPTETMIQVETIAALAPGADVIAYETPDLSNTSVLDAYHKAIQDNLASVLNSSFGECDGADPAFDVASERDAMHASALGITFVAASGDTGSACFDPANSKHIVDANAPASDRHIVGVGGTESRSGRLTATPCPCPISTPIAWDDRNFSFGGLSGGGVSRHWPLPSYQSGVVGVASTTKRNVPDMSFPAVDDDAIVNGVDGNVDGTSWSSAIASALFVETVQICGRLGYANPALYKLFGKGPHAYFFDPIAGFNGAWVPKLSKGYNAAPGYDNVTGVGMPYGFTFSVAFCGKST